MSIQTDKEPETVEEFKEIARHIGISNGYASVGITGIEPIESEITDEGEILLRMVKNNDEYQEESRKNIEESIVIEGTVLDD